MPFLDRCATGLREGGLIIVRPCQSQVAVPLRSVAYWWTRQVKENNCAEGFIVDKTDSSLTRSSEYYLGLFEQANLKVVKICLQKGVFVCIGLRAPLASAAACAAGCRVLPRAAAAARCRGGKEPRPLPR